MSGSGAETGCCANCGIAEVDDIQLEDCDGCDLVKYCSDNNCKEEHREQHEDECQKRAQILHDRKLFTQPDGSHLGECPLCFLPMPLEGGECAFQSCCSKLVCKGCVYANHKSNGGLNCPFCREPVPKDAKEHEKRIMERVKANDPDALSYMGTKRFVEGDYDGALTYLTKAAELGDLKAHYQLGVMYRRGEGVEKDEEKAVYHYEEAAMGGHPWARNNLDVSRKKMATWGEQRNTSSLLPTSETMIQ